MFKKLCLVAALFPFLNVEAEEAAITKYLYRLNSNNISCIAKLDEIYVFSNRRSKEPVSMAINVSPFLENGKNTVMLSIGALDFQDDKQVFSPDSRCEAQITKETPDKSSEYVTIVGTVDEHLKPTGKFSPEYENRSYVLDKKEYYVTPSKPNASYYRVSREFTVEGLPEWAWTKADKFEPTEENMAKLRAAYTKLWTLFQNKDNEGIKKMADISFSEKEMAHTIETKDYWFASLGYENDFKHSEGMRPINWDNFKLETYKEGRLVQLEDEDGISPIHFITNDGSIGSNYNPFFSLINGEIVLTR